MGLDDLNIVNMLCELFIGKGDYKKGVDLVNKICQKKGGGEKSLPIDLLINQVWFILLFLHIFCIYCNLFTGDLPCALE